ncbi:FtsX-like permease family protein [Actinoplanes sp. NPDC051343]|uniref:FtsX-like permease family protein n=1 Tax=Actinoplanes sp. NPDC051343 TaxID=3363906 RepID=UPI003788C708
MSTFGLSLRTLRFRPGGYAASFLAMFLGAILLMSFGSLLDTANATGDSGSQEALRTPGFIVVGWSLPLVTYAVAAMLSLHVRQRAEELGLLKRLGATPGQVTRLVFGETAALTVLALAAALVPGALIGRALLAWMISADQVADDVKHQFGGLAIGSGAAVSVVGALLAVVFTARRIGRGGAGAETAGRRTKLGKIRVIAAILFLLLGVNLAVVTATVMHGAPGSDPMATAGQASIFAAIGFALIAPPLLRGMTRLLSGLLSAASGPIGSLAGINLRRNVGNLSSAAMPIIMFTGIAGGTLYMVATDNAARDRIGLAKTAYDRNVEATNLIVIGMLLLFAALMVVNTLAAATVDRRREFGQLRLLGTTPAQLIGMVAGESLALTLAGAFYGLIAAAFTFLPYAYAKEIHPAGGIGIYLGILGTAALISIASTVVVTLHNLRRPAAAAAVA